MSDLAVITHAPVYTVSGPLCVGCCHSSLLTQSVKQVDGVDDSSAFFFVSSSFLKYHSDASQAVLLIITLLTASSEVTDVSTLPAHRSSGPAVLSP